MDPLPATRLAVACRMRSQLPYRSYAAAARLRVSSLFPFMIQIYAILGLVPVECDIVRKLCQ